MFFAGWVREGRSSLPLSVKGSAVRRSPYLYFGGFPQCGSEKYKCFYKDTRLLTTRGGVSLFVSAQYVVFRRERMRGNRALVGNVCVRSVEKLFRLSGSYAWKSAYIQRFTHRPDRRERMRSWKCFEPRLPDAFES